MRFYLVGLTRLHHDAEQHPKLPLKDEPNKIKFKINHHLVLNDKCTSCLKFIVSEAWLTVQAEVLCDIDALAHEVGKNIQLFTDLYTEKDHQ